MYSAHVTLNGISPMVMSRYYAEDFPKKSKESNPDYEERTWRHRLHINEEGFVYVPGVFLKNALSETAKYLSEKIPGRGNTTFTKFFEAGISVPTDSVLDLKPEDVKCLRLFVPADGVRGGSKRVMKNFPQIDKWKLTFTIKIYDSTITEDVLVRYLQQCGLFIGLGSFRPRNNGTNGRFRLEQIQCEPFKL